MDPQSLNMKRILEKTYASPVVGAIFHTTAFCLQRELADCETVLDLGCGPESPVSRCMNIKHSVGVEAFAPYFERAKANHTHNELLNEKIQNLKFEPNAFDAVVMIEVIEHLADADAEDVLRLAEMWARKKVIVTSPNGFVAQKAVDDNPLQAHLSGWDLDRMKSRGFRSKGLLGLKVLRQEVHGGTMAGDLLATMRFRPRVFWFFVSSLSQIVTYYVPRLAFGLFSVKTKSSGAQQVRTPG